MVEGAVLERLYTGDRIESSNLSLSVFFRPKTLYFFVVRLLEYLGAVAPLRTVYCASVCLELKRFSLKNFSSKKALLRCYLPLSPIFLETFSPNGLKEGSHSLIAADIF